MENEAHEKLISVIICSYRKFQFIYEAIASVLNQSYGKIELLISDDGSDPFPEKKIRTYIDKHRKDNLVNVLIHHEETNQGTVRHLNHAIRLVHEDYIGILAADDAYFDKFVLERFAAGFDHAKKDCYVQMAQTAMCDYTLKRIDGYALFPDVQEAVEQEDSRLFELVAYSACLPTTSFFYKKEFFEQYGEFDEEFYLVEDYPMHCRIVREGWKLHYENFAAARHRSGGISHGNVEGLSKSAYFYHLDMLKIRDKCVKPYLKQLRRKAMEDVKDKAWTEEKWIKSQLHLYENNKKLRRQYLWEYKWSLLKDFAVASVYRWDVFASCLWKTALVLAVMIPPVREIGIVAAACAGCYKVIWSLFAAGAVSWLFGRIGRGIAKIESYPWDLMDY